MELAGKVALITGGGRGAGRAIALAFARQGAAVAVIARTRTEIDAVATEIQALGRRAIAVPCDLTDKAQVAAAVAAVREHLGPVDILVNSAGMGFSAKTIEMDDDIWERVLRLNLTAPYYCLKAVLPDMIARRWGRIINIASTSSKVAYLYTAAYTASKHGLLGLTRAVALEMNRYNITVNAIGPSFMATEFAYDSARNIAAKTGCSFDEAVATLGRMSPQNRLIEPEEVAHVALMLASEAAKGITGQCLQVDGGTVMS